MQFYVLNSVNIFLEIEFIGKITLVSHFCTILRENNNNKKEVSDQLYFYTSISGKNEVYSG